MKIKFGKNKSYSWFFIDIFKGGFFVKIFPMSYKKEQDALEKK